MNEETLFHEALARPAAERAAFLDAACVGRAELRAAVEALLEAHDASGVLDRPAVDRAAVARPDGLGAGSLVGGRYALVERIGEGGMGEVWVARQTEPIQRRVALKLIKAGMDSRAVLDRFEQERQALAIMDHPNIARVIDAGLTQTGQPYFAMELVNGAPLTQFCDDARLSPRERLELFVPICQAVQHAHQKGIVHRDLKPANILVTIVDGKPVPKVIDFGVAKATQEKLTERTLETEFGGVVGTLEYMSPEQAGFSGVDIDTRADIYSLGVVLYELLTGLRPIDAKALRTAAMMEMVRLIRDQDPPRPSTRVSTHDSGPSLAALRRIEPRRLSALLRGELDWIVMKCLEKQRDRRYESASGLARDVERYLAGEAIEARPPTRGYRIAKFLRRHRGPVAAAALVLLALVGGVIGTSIGFVRADEQRRVAESADERSRKRLTQVEHANDLLGSIFSALNPQGTGHDENVPLRVALANRLDEAASRLEGEALGDPVLMARLQFQLGTSMVGLGEPEKGARILDRSLATLEDAVEPHDRLLLTAMNSLASAYGGLGRHDDSIALAHEVLRRAREAYGPDDSLSLLTLHNLGAAYQHARRFDEAFGFLEEALDRLQRVMPDDPLTALCMSNLATCCVGPEEVARARGLFEEAYRRTVELLGPASPSTLMAATNLAILLGSQREFARAIELLEGSFRAAKRDLGDRAPLTLHVMRSLAETHRRAGRPELALPLVEQEARIARERYGPSDERTLEVLDGLATTFMSARRLDEAIPRFEDVRRRREALLGREDPTTLATVLSLGRCYVDAGRLDEARPLLEEVYAHAPQHPELYEVAIPLLMLAQRTNDAERGLAIARPALRELERRFGADSSEVQSCRVGIGSVLGDLARFDEASKMFESALASQEATLGRDHPLTLGTIARLGMVRSGAGDSARAIALLEEYFSHDAAGPERLPAVITLARSYLALGRTDDALALLERARREPAEALDPAAEVELKATLAHALFLANRLPEAAAACREVVALRTERSGRDAPATRLSIFKLAQTLSSSGELEEAAKLYDELLAAIDAGWKDAPPLEHWAAAVQACYERLGREADATAVVERVGREILAKDPDDARALTILNAAAVRHWQAGRVERSVPLFEELVRSHERRVGAEHGDTIRAKANLGVNYASAGRFAEAVPLLEVGYRRLAERPELGFVAFHLAHAYARCGNAEGAVALVKDVDATLPPDGARRGGALAVLGQALVEAGAYAEAEPLVRECLAIRAKLLPDSWLAANARVLVGRALLGRGKLEEAEPLLDAGTKALLELEETIPPPGRPRVAEAIAALVDLYERTDRPDEAAMWRKELEARK